MTEADLDEYLRYVPTPEGWVLEVAHIEWPHPHEPAANWKTFRHWQQEPKAESKARAKAAAIKRYFRTCTHCGQLNQVGHMHNRTICQSCAERVLGVIH